MIVKLKIAFSDKNVGDVVELENRIAKHFIAKGWAVEEIEPEAVKEPKKGKK